MIVKNIPTGGGGRRASGGDVFNRVADYIANERVERGPILAAE